MKADDKIKEEFNKLILKCLEGGGYYKSGGECLLARDSRYGNIADQYIKCDYYKNGKCTLKYLEQKRLKCI